MTLLQTAEWLGIDGFLDPAELEALVEWADGRDVLDVGRQRGISASAMALVANSLCCVETGGAALWQAGGLADAFRRAVQSQRRIDFYCCDSETAGEVIARHFDLVFLDTRPTELDTPAGEQAFARHLERWHARLRPGGRLALHDYRGEVKRLADEALGAPASVTVTLAAWEKP